MSIFVKKVDHEMGKYAPREYLVLLRPFGIEENDTTKYLAYSSKGGERATSLLSGLEGLFVGMAPSTGYSVKLWDTKKFAGVARELVSRYGAHIFLIGSGADHVQIEKVLSEVSELGNVHNMSDKFSVDELKAFISKLDLFISVDTGPVYIAEAFGVKTIDIVGPMDEREQPPRGENHIALVAERKAPAIHIMNTRVYDYLEARRQADAITVEDVLNAVQKLIPRTTGNK
jgi:ADP-heptose:LPS heptosyltransferase